MATTFKKVTDRLSRLAYRMLKSPAEVMRMLETGDPDMMILGDALRVALDGMFRPADKAWIQEIEALRAELSASTREVVVDDFGRLPPGMRLIPERPLGGRTYVSTVGKVTNASPRPYCCLMLLSLVRAFNVRSAVELGTGVGLSSAYIAAGMTAERGGQVWTLEGADALVELARRNHEALGLDNIEVVLGRFQDTLDRVLRRAAPVELVFFDGHHERAATLNYFSRVLPCLAPRALLVFRDTQSAEMQQAWAQISAHERVDVAVDLGRAGVCLVRPSAGRHMNFKIVFS